MATESQLHNLSMLATEISGTILVASARTLCRGEETLLASGWTLIGSELSSPNFNSSVRAEWSFALRYLNVVIKPLCGNLDICLNYEANAYFRSQNAVRVLSVTDRDRRWKMFFGSRFSVSLLCNVADLRAQVAPPKWISVAKNLSARMHLLIAGYDQDWNPQSYPPLRTHTYATSSNKKTVITGISRSL